MNSILRPGVLRIPSLGGADSSPYLEPGYKDGDILVEICESVVEEKKEIGELRFKTLPKIQAACVFHKGSYRTFSESYEMVLR